MRMPKLSNKSKDTVMHVRMPTDLHKWLKIEAVKNGRTLRGELVKKLEMSREL
jgi:hypothetical protein